MAGVAQEYRYSTYRIPAIHASDINILPQRNQRE